jgi:hypothetical protein
VMDTKAFWGTTKEIIVPDTGKQNIQISINL